MEKTTHPTSTYSAACDYFDTFINAQIHATKQKEQKLQITMNSEGEDKELSVSLYREDVEMLFQFLQAAKDYVELRNK